MPPVTRRSKASPSNQPLQSTLSFKSTSKVTKPGIGVGKSLLDKSSQDATSNKPFVVEIPKLVKETEKEKEKGKEKDSQKPKQESKSQTKLPEPGLKGHKEEKEKEQQEEQQEEDDHHKGHHPFDVQEEAVLAPSPEGEPDSNDTSILLPSLTNSETDLSKSTTFSHVLTAEEHLASALPRSQIKDYHAAILASRKCKPVHQEDLSLNEKILRHFDLSSQYGPCIGITRMNRWKRAHNMGLKPPIEVLAVCLEDEAKLKRDTRNAYIDEFSV